MLYNLYKNRRYHNLYHIQDCLKLLDKHPVPDGDPVMVELALWFHDAINDPLGRDNEKDSAKLARHYLNGLSPTRIEQVEALILATAHDSMLKDLNQKWIVDIDLAVLGKSRQDYQRYEEAIRAEYHMIPERLFRNGRRDILKAFLLRPSIYSTEVFKDFYEVQARENLIWALGRIPADKPEEKSKNWGNYDETTTEGDD
jgi:predicted metal-dependent HD superfamily phosphohydrolase